MNIKGYESLDEVMDRAQQPLDATGFEVVANETAALMLDTRDPEVFAKGFIPNSINIGLNGSFAQWVGELIPSVKQEILLIAEPGTEEEAITRLSRVGYDGVIGFLKGGFETWMAAGKEIDTVNRLDAADFDTKFAEETVLIFDVRKKSEFDSQHVIGATNVPLNQLNQHLAQLPKDKPFVLHCAGGYRSMIASSMLKQRGWEQITDIRGGFDAIKQTSVPVTEYVCPTTLL